MAGKNRLLIALPLLFVLITPSYANHLGVPNNVGGKVTANTLEDTADYLSIPAFIDIEQSGAVLYIHGRAASAAQIELLNGARRLGAVQADMNGHFTFTVNTSIKPGQYQWVLRSTELSGRSATSVQTLNVTVSGEAGDSIFAILDEPGKPGRFMLEGKESLRPAKDAKNRGFILYDAAFDAGQLLISGQARGAFTVLVSIDNKRVASGKVLDGGNFLINRSLRLPIGDHIMRIDSITLNGDTAGTIRLPFRVNDDGKTGQAVTGKTHEQKYVDVKDGDSLSSIAQSVYGSERYALDIFEANRDQLKTEQDLKKGQRLILPVVDTK